MAQFFHFEHHRREAMTNRRRFSFITAVFVVVLAIVVYYIYHATHAASLPTDKSMPPQVSLTANNIAGSVTINQNSSLTLSWIANNSPQNCTAYGYSSWSGTKKVPSGTEDRNADTKNTGTITYSLSCSNNYGTNTAAVKVTVVTAPPSVRLAANSKSSSNSYQMLAGQALELVWSSSNSSSCQASGKWSGSRPLYGNEDRSADTKTAGTYTYNLTCANSQGVSAGTSLEVEVNFVPPPPASQPPSPKPVSSPAPPSPSQNSQPVATQQSDNSASMASPDTSAAPPSTPGSSTAQSVIAILAASGKAKLILFAAFLVLLMAGLFLLLRRQATGGASFQGKPMSDSAAVDVAGPAVSRLAKGNLFSVVSHWWTSTVAFFATSGPATGKETQEYPAEEAAGPAETIDQPATLDALVTQLKDRPIESVPTEGEQPQAEVQTSSDTGLRSTRKFGVLEAAVVVLVITGVYLVFRNQSQASTGVTKTGLPPTVTLSANGKSGSITIATGSSLTLSWSTGNQPQSCSASSSPSLASWQGGRGASGSENHTADTGTARKITYSLTCANSSGSGNASVAVSITSPAPPYPTPTPAPTPPPPTNKDTQPPSLPGQFSVKPSGSSLSLAWQASTDNVGVDHYTLERSLDQATWSAIGGSIGASQTSYSDSAVQVGVHYYYRLRAYDAAANVSGYALTDAMMTDASANTQPGEITVTSDDGFASAIIPNGSIDSKAQCLFTLSQDLSNLKNGTSTLLRGPYVLDCKSNTGDEISDYKQAVQIALGLNDDQLNKYDSFVFMEQDSGGNWIGSKTAKYDKGSKSYVELSASPKTFALLGSVKKSYLKLILSILIPLVVLFVFVIYVRLRQSQAARYEAFIRNKYYNF